MIKSLIPKIGKQAKFLSNLNELKSHGDINNIPDEFNQVKLIEWLNVYNIIKFVKIWIPNYVQLFALRVSKIKLIFINN